MLDDLKSNQEQLERELEANRERTTASKRPLEVEAKKRENSKAWGQPVQAKLEETLSHHGIDHQASHGGDVDGNACRRLMGSASDQQCQMQSCILEQESIVEGISEETTRKVCEGHVQLLCALDGFFLAS